MLRCDADVDFGASMLTVISSVLSIIMKTMTTSDNGNLMTKKILMKKKRVMATTIWTLLTHRNKSRMKQKKTKNTLTLSLIRILAVVTMTNHYRKEGNKKVEDYSSKINSLEQCHLLCLHIFCIIIVYVCSKHSSDHVLMLGQNPTMVALDTRKFRHKYIFD